MPTRRIRYLVEQCYIKPVGGYGRGVRAGYTRQNLLDIALIEALARIEGKALLVEILANVDWSQDEYLQALSKEAKITVDIGTIRRSVNFPGDSET